MMRTVVTKKKWEVISKKVPINEVELLDILLSNRGLSGEKEKDLFLHPVAPQDLTLKDLGIDVNEAQKTVKRISKAIKDKEQVVIYGDYDADGISATAILWEALYSQGLDVLPYIPERFSEGYGIKFDSVAKLKEKSSKLSLLITVDNGVVAEKEIEKINKLGIDVLVCDHHQKGKVLPKAYSFFYSDKVCGAALSWTLAREVTGKINGLDLATVGTIADQMPLLGVNRSFAKFGIESLRNTKRLGLLALFKEAGVDSANMGTYEINYVVAPRINAMGRLSHAIDSLRLLCAKNLGKATELSDKLGKTNLERQKIVDEVIAHARSLVSTDSKIVILTHESYHEGVIGLAAGKLVEEFYRPAIVISKGETVSKASARSITGFNIIESIRKFEHLIIEGGGHPMAAGFSIKTENIEEFKEAIEKLADETLGEELLLPKIRVDVLIPFSLINEKVESSLSIFSPTGLGNPNPTFETDGVEVVEQRLVGKTGKHLKLVLKKDEKYIDAIAFGFGYMDKEINKGDKLNIIYNIEENVWNGNTSLQLKIKDIQRV
jgi:single-stranded-DNA-specific exonuclease